MTYVIRVTEEQMNVLGQFLSRVNLNAKEVDAFNDLRQALGSAVPEQEAAPEQPTDPE